MMSGGKRPAGREGTIAIPEGVRWSVQPPEGLRSGRYYRTELCFGAVFEGARGYRAVLEAAEQNGRLVFLHYDEAASPEYYIQRYQSRSKRYSDYGFFQAEKERTARCGVVLANGISAMEQQMLEQSRLTGDFDLLTGASNSVCGAFLPLAEQIAIQMQTSSTQRLYSLARPQPSGLTPWLRVVFEGERIISCKYDEIFADAPEDIAEEALRPFYRQSKYHAADYASTCAAGFNTVFDRLEQHVLRTGSLTDLAGLPFLTGARRCEEYEDYLTLAQEIIEERAREHANV